MAKRLTKDQKEAKEISALLQRVTDIWTGSSGEVPDGDSFGSAPQLENFICGLRSTFDERSDNGEWEHRWVWELRSLTPTADGRILQAVKEGAEQCVNFAQEVFNDIWPNGDIDGGHLQELGEKHGLLTPVKVTEPCGDACGCKDFINEVEFAEGHECFKKHSILLGKD